MDISFRLGDTLFRIITDAIVGKYVAPLFKSNLAAPLPAHREVTIRMRIGTTEERAHWAAVRQKRMFDNPNGIYLFTESPFSVRLTRCSVELLSDNSTDWIWLSTPSTIPVMGGSPCMGSFFRMWHRTFIPVHCAVIGKQDRFILIPANGGSGKSTLTASAKASGWDVICDDFAWLHQRNGTWYAESPYSFIRLNEDSISLLQKAHLSSEVWKDAPRRKDGKRIIKIENMPFSGKVIGCLAICHSERPGRIEPLTDRTEIIKAFRSSAVLLKMHHLDPRGYLGAVANLTRGLHTGKLHRSPNLVNNLKEIEKWLKQI